MKIVKKIRRVLTVAVFAAAAALGTALPALASVHTPFVVIVNGGIDVTSRHLTAGQVVYRGGVAEHVVSASGHAVRFIPAVTGPSGAVIQFST